MIGKVFFPCLRSICVIQTAREGGRPPFAPVLMFKVIVLQKYYGLSEEDTEWQILDLTSFQRFLGIEREGRVPY